MFEKHTITKGLIDFLGASIEVESEVERGTIFRVHSRGGRNICIEMTVKGDFFINLIYSIMTAMAMTGPE